MSSRWRSHFQAVDGLLVRGQQPIVGLQNLVRLCLSQIPNYMRLWSLSALRCCLRFALDAIHLLVAVVFAGIKSRAAHRSRSGPVNFGFVTDRREAAELVPKGQVQGIGNAGVFFGSFARSQSRWARCSPRVTVSLPLQPFRLAFSVIA